MQGFWQLIEGQIWKLIRVDGLGGGCLFGQHASILRADSRLILEQAAAVCPYRRIIFVPVIDATEM